jgi:hypothetical protein
MKTPTRDPQPIFTFERMLQWREKEEGIVFTEDERSLAQSVATAIHFAFTLLEELPTHAALHTIASMSWSHGMNQVIARRSGRVWP